MMRSGTDTNFTYSAEQLADILQTPRAVVVPRKRSKRTPAIKSGKDVAPFQWRCYLSSMCPSDYVALTDTLLAACCSPSPSVRGVLTCPMAWRYAVDRG